MTAQQKVSVMGDQIFGPDVSGSKILAFNQMGVLMDLIHVLTSISFSPSSCLSVFFLFCGSARSSIILKNLPVLVT